MSNNLMNFWFYGIDGEFWSWKTSLAVYFAKKISKDKNSIIITNIKLDPDLFPNYIYFEDTQLLRVFRTDNFINDIERNVNWKPNKKGSLRNWIRSKFIKTYILFDESNALQNNREWEKFDKAFKYYLNQPRKNFEAIYLIWADGDSNEKSFKKFVKWWYYVVPFMQGFPILSDIWVIRARQKDDFWNTKELAYKTEEKDWFIRTEYVPIDIYVDWFYKPLVWSFYDDLHKNIPDDDKNNIDYSVLWHYFELQPHLQTQMEIEHPKEYKKFLESEKYNVKEQLAKEEKPLKEEKQEFKTEKIIKEEIKTEEKEEKTEIKKWRPKKPLILTVRKKD